MSVICWHCHIENSHRDPFCLRCGNNIRQKPLEKGKRDACWFCQKVCKLTREHVIPQVLYKYLGLEEENFVHLVGYPQNPSEYTRQFVYGEGRLAKRTSIKGHWAPIVCGECNNGWMRNLNNEALPIIIQFIKGEVGELSWSERKCLARWISVVACCAEYYIGDAIIPQWYRTLLMQGDVFPQWIFSYGKMDEKKSLNGAIHNCNALLEGVENKDSYFNSTWIGLGKSVLHCFAVSREYHLFYTIGYYPDFQKMYGLRGIWPPMKNDREIRCGTLDFKTVRNAQDRIKMGSMAPQRQFKPDDVDFFEP